MSKANRQKGVKREKYRFTCDAHDAQLRGPVRFIHEDSRKDWHRHNIMDHDGVKSRMDKSEAIGLLDNQKIHVLG